MHKKAKRIKKIFFVKNKCQNVTHVSTSIFQGFLFKYIVFRSVALVINKLYSILDFFLHKHDFLLPCTLLYGLTKRFDKKSLKFLFIKSK